MMQQAIRRTNILRFGFVLALAVAASCGLGKSEVIDLRATIQGPTTLQVGSRHQYVATIESTPAAFLTSPAQPVFANWVSSNPGVATVTPHGYSNPSIGADGRGGLVTALSVGQAVITATPTHGQKGVSGAMTPGTITITIVQ